VDNSWIRQLVEWTSRGLVNSRTGQVAVSRMAKKRKLSTQSRRWHPRVVQSASWPVRESSSPWVGNPRVGICVSCPANTITTTITSTSVQWSFFQVSLGQLFPSHPPPPPVLEENHWGLVEWGFYRSDVLCAVQPSLSKQWRQHGALTLTSGLALVRSPSTTGFLTEKAPLPITQAGWRQYYDDGNVGMINLLPNPPSNASSRSCPLS